MFRALPILIIFMVIMIGSKILEILEIAPDYIGVKSIQAAEDKPDERNKETNEKPQITKDSKALETAPIENKTTPILNNHESKKDSETSIENDKSPKLNFTQSEVDILQELAKRREELDQREKDILIKENSYDIIEKNIDTKIINLQLLQEKLKSILAEYEAKEDDKYKSLVKIYEAMKPVDAAKIFEQLEMNILLEVCVRMKESKLAMIFSKMDPDKAKELTIELANRRKVEGID